MQIYLAEDKEGYNVRPKNHFVYRAEYGKKSIVELFATKFGLAPNTSLDVRLERSKSIISGIKDSSNEYSCNKANPVSELTYYNFSCIGTPTPSSRPYRDGQVFALQYVWGENRQSTDRLEAMNAAIYIHVYDEVDSSEEWTWIENVQPIFQLYANLFPVMESFVNLADYHSVVEKKCHIITSMSLPFEDPQFMPVTRDLSKGKTDKILIWLMAEKPKFGIIHDEAQLLNKDHLLDMLQTALELEHATIPIYLNGFFSIKPWKNEEVKQMLHQIIVDEMFHFAQVANIINALGGRPCVLGKTFVPSFPSHLPGGCRPKMIASINKISAEQIHDVYMEIEQPGYILKDEDDLVGLMRKVSKSKKYFCFRNKIFNHCVLFGTSTGYKLVKISKFRKLVFQLLEIFDKYRLTKLHFQVNC